LARSEKATQNAVNACKVQTKDEQQGAPRLSEAEIDSSQERDALKVLQIRAASISDNFGQLDGSWLTFVWTSLRAAIGISQQAQS